MDRLLLNKLAEIAAMGPEWVFTAAEGEVARMDLRGLVGWDMDAVGFSEQLTAVTAGSIELHIDSPGGNVWEGVAIANALRQHPARVDVHVDAMAASAASVIAMAGDTITMHPGSMMMVHNARGSVFSATADEFRSTAVLLDKVNINMADIYTARAGGSRDAWLETMAGEEWYRPEEAVAAGLADTAIDPAAGDDEDEDESQLVAGWDPKVFGYQGPSPGPSSKNPDTSGGGGQAPDRVEQAATTIDLAAQYAALFKPPQPAAIDLTAFAAAVTTTGKAS